MKSALIPLLLFPTVVAAQTGDARQSLVDYLNKLAASQLAARSQTVAGIQTRSAAEQRQAAVRAQILKLIGGLPTSTGHVAVRTFGEVPGDGLRIEKIAYESLPGLFVTADVYVPTSGGGPFPAVLITPGHGPTGKLGEYDWGANLARNGIIALAVDPMGQGERLQHFDAKEGKSVVGQGTGEHGHAGFSTLLIGDHVARYFINDAMRGIDYLSARKDVDAARIGAFGCSGGGTATAYIAALDNRVKVAATACYITAFEELLPSRTGNQEAEQSIPGFISGGLDLADWVELAAPKPYAIISTTEDMFPYAGAQRSYEEAKRIYALYNAADRLQRITGPGGHGALGPISPQILKFLVNGLKPGAEVLEFKASPREAHTNLLCTPTGQVSTSLGGETIESINRKRAESIVRMKPANLASVIRTAAAVTAQPGAAPEVTVVQDRITLHSEPGIDLAGMVVVPHSGGRHPAALFMDSAPIETAAASPEFMRLSNSGHVILILQPRGTPGSDKPVQSPYLGPMNLISLRAMLVGKTLVGMRVDDTIRAINWLASRPDVDSSSITVYGDGPLGVVALHAAVLDPRITGVVVENTLASYRLALDAPLHRNLADVIVPGVLRQYDLNDLVAAIHPRPVTILHPVNAVGDPLPQP